jgi:hypothetical protein
LTAVPTGAYSSGPLGLDAPFLLCTEMSSPGRELSTEVRTMKPHLIALGVVAVIVGACNQEPAFVRKTQEVDLIHALQDAILKSVEAEKSAVLATTDEESRSFASEAQRFATEINRLRRDLRQLVTADRRPQETARLDAFDAAWGEFEDVDTRLLALAVANTNLKATRLSVRDGAAALDRFVDLLVEMQSTSADAELIRRLLMASISALRVQSLLLAHIPSSDDAEMTLLEKRVGELNAEADGQLAAVGQAANYTWPEQLGEAMRAWSEYRRITAEVLRLSRQNTNVLSFDVSVHEKRRVTKDCLSALGALLETIESVPQGTR